MLFRSRVNHEVMIRGTFANIRLRNQLAPGTECGFTRDFTKADAPVSSIYDASVNYLKARIPLVILTGKEYGSGSPRDGRLTSGRRRPIKSATSSSREAHAAPYTRLLRQLSSGPAGHQRSEERRVGKEWCSKCRSRWSADHSKKKKKK